MAITLDKLLRCHMTEDEARRFKRVEVEIRDDCWLAISHSLTSTGYPRWRGLQSNLMTPMQRDIYEKTHGTSIPDDKVVIRTCGNKN